jgi:hypothetical protein
MIREKIRVTTVTIQEKFTFNDYNNLLLDISFWNNFNSEYIVLFSTLSFLKCDLFNNNSSLWLNNYFISNNNTNIVDSINTLFSIRSTKYMIELVKNYSKTNNETNNETNNDFGDFTYKTLNIRNPIEHIFKNNINKNINLVYLEEFERNIIYIDKEYKLVDILLNMR